MLLGGWVAAFNPAGVASQKHLVDPLVFNLAGSLHDTYPESGSTATEDGSLKSLLNRTVLFVPSRLATDIVLAVESVQ